MNRRRGKQDPDPSADDEVEKDVRSRRRFSLGEAIGREGGRGLLRGASPVARQRQLELAVEDLLDARLDDPEGALRTVLLRAARAELEVADGEEADALRLLDRMVRSTLASQRALEELVRRCDAEWGRAFGERPRFDRPGEQAAEDDPYTAESVRQSLESLLEGLEKS